MELNFKELRLGNLIHWSNQSVIVGIEFYHFKEFFFYEKKAKELYKPINLTEDLLIRFGFKKIDTHFENDDCWVYLHRDSRAFGFEHIFSKLEGSECDGRVNLNRTYRFVHELQNLYFSINNKELILK